MRTVIISFGGHAFYPMLYIKSIIDKNADVMVFVPDKQKKIYSELIGNTGCIKFYKKPRMRNPLNIKVLNEIFKDIEHYNPDIVHLLSYYPWLYFYKWKLKKYRLVLTVHDPAKHSGDTESRIVPGSEKQLYAQAAHIITLGEQMCRQLMDETGKSKSAVSVIAHGNYNIYTRWAKPDISEQENTVLFFGRLYAYKGIEHLIRAAEKVRDKIPNARFVIAGSGSKKYTDQLKQMIGGKEYIDLHDQYIPDEKIADYYQQASLSVLPYIEATQSGALMISYAFKKPVVVTKTGSLSEYVDEGKTGCIVSPGDSDALADKIIYLLENPELRKPMGLNGFKKAENDYSWDITGEKAMALYSGLVESDSLSVTGS